MAQSDAIMDYSNNGHYSTADKAADVLAVWEANKGDASTARSDHAWSGDPTLAPTTPLSGWDVGMFKMLPLGAVAYDTSYELPECTVAHSMLRNIKSMFNLPNNATDDQWKNDYGVFEADNYLNNGEAAFFLFVSKNIASAPMMLSRPSMMSSLNAGVPGDSDHIWPGDQMPHNLKCALIIGLQGWNLDVGVGRGISLTVRPDDDDVASYNNHYKALRDAGTPAADYTDPTATGAEYVVEGNILLLNYENQWRPTTLNADTDRINLVMTWPKHTYAEIKELIDAAIVTP